MVAQYFYMAELRNLPGLLKKYVSISRHLSWSKPREIEHKCWEMLFRAYWLMPCILQPRTGFGKSLEMSFELMIFLAAVSFQLIVDGGVVFVGYSTILYPTVTNGTRLSFTFLPHTNAKSIHTCRHMAATEF